MLKLELRSYSAAPCESILCGVAHNTGFFANNRAEVSHQPTRQRERHIRRFKSAGQAHRFLSLHGVVQNLFRVGRHLLRSTNHRLLRSRSLAVWQTVAAASRDPRTTDYYEPNDAPSRPSLQSPG